MSSPAATIDVRTVVPRERHPLIFSTFHGLPQGSALELVNDHRIEKPMPTTNTPTDTRIIGTVPMTDCRWKVRFPMRAIARLFGPR